MKRLILAGVLVSGLTFGTAGSVFAGDPGPPPPPKDEHCNSGRGNSSEDNTSQLIIPGEGTGPGIFVTIDCDPGNSGDVNRGGD